MIAVAVDTFEYVLCSGYVVMWLCGMIIRGVLHKPFPRAFSRAARPIAVRRCSRLQARVQFD